MAGDLAATIAGLGARADLLGHSMGGKAAMVLALSEPAGVRRLVVADMAPTSYGHSQMEYVRAMQAVDLAAVRRRADADAMLSAAVPEASLRGFFLQSLALGPSGAAWKLNLPALADEMPGIMAFPELAGRFEGPTLFLTGGRSDYVRPEHWPEIRRLFPGARHVEIPGAGHWLHADAPDAFAAAVAEFLDAP
jgi:pimeloyl-ACP methyl ester carboxylesterase